MVFAELETRRSVSPANRFLSHTRFLSTDLFSSYSPLGLPSPSCFLRGIQIYPRFRFLLGHLGIPDFASTLRRLHLCFLPVRFSSIKELQNTNLLVPRSWKVLNLISTEPEEFCFLGAHCIKFHRSKVFPRVVESRFVHNGVYFEAITQEFENAWMDLKVNAAELVC